MKSSSCILLALAIACVLIKSSDSCVAPDCDRLDCGACGNACCRLEFFLNKNVALTKGPPPRDLNNMLTSLLKSGGPDNGYSFVVTEDLTPYNLTAQYILQGVHTTLVKRYNDTLNFVLYPVQEKSYYHSKLSGFSISKIGGAYCDEGQNYKNLVQLVKALGLEYIENHVFGCAPPNLP